jgi:hypothetical protein
MAVTVVDQTLMWLGGLADDTEDGVLVLARQLTWLGGAADDIEDGVLILARQIAALRATAVTAIGRRSGRTLRELRLQHRELKLARRERELTRMHWDLLETQQELNAVRDAGARYLARLRAVVMTYSPGPMVATPLPFPRASQFFDGFTIDEDAVEAVLVNNLRVDDTTRNSLMDRIPELSRIPR